MNEEPWLQPVGSRGRVGTYRVPRPRAGIVEVSAGQFEATEYADRRTGWRGRALKLKDALTGDAMSNARLAHERLSKRVALAVFSSDALSSTAYATQEILLILVLAGTVHLQLSLPIALAITALLAIVVASYRQTVRAYPGGGGAYIVAHENLGTAAGLTAAAALLVDYVLTVSVSVAASVEAIVAAVPAAHPFAVLIASLLVCVIALGNLRGIRESGTIFSIPTYGFLVILSAALVAGFMRALFGDSPNVFAAGAPTKEVGATHALTAFLVLRAFASGCTALTGVEAISNGVSAFKPPEAKNAAATLLSMGVILGTLFLGLTLLARHYGIVFTADDRNTVMSQVGEIAFGGRNVWFFLLQAFTAGILFLAANTAYADFPRLSAILARDGYLPRFFHQRGNRLVFTYGIAMLTAFSIVLLIAFNAETTRLIPLYALGVFLSFTLSQAGMVRKWRRDRTPGWRRAASINAVGAVTTAIVFAVIMATKFASGAWAVVLLVPLLAYWFWRIGGYYRRLSRELHVSPVSRFDIAPHGPSRTVALVPIETVNLAAVTALVAACERSRNVTAIYVNYDAEREESFMERWDQQFPNIPLVVINSPYRTVAEPLSWYITDLLQESPGATVFLPLIRPRRWYQRALVNQSLRRLKGLLRRRRGVVFVDQPFPVS